MSDYLQSGHDMWNDHKAHYGVITARIMCLRYLDLQAGKTDPEERQFCRELREAMSAEPNLKDQAFYPHSYETALLGGEAEMYNDSEMANIWCAGEIDDAIKACEYGDGSHRLKPAVQAFIDHCSAERLSFVLALEVRRHESGFSAANRDWARGVDIQNSFSHSGIRARTEVLDEFITCFCEATGRIRVEMLEKAAAFIVERSAGETTSGNYITYMGDLPADIISPGAFAENVEDIAAIVAEYEAVVDIEVTSDGAIDINMGLDYCPNFDATLEADGDYPDDRIIKDPLLTRAKGRQSPPMVNITGRDAEEEKPSVLKQIRDAQNAPQPHRKPKEPGQNKKKNDIEH
jgi:hypothetical protein